jgi:hypothetical protein
MIPSKTKNSGIKPSQVQVCVVSTHLFEGAIRACFIQTAWEWKIKKMKESSDIDDYI